jgi:flagellar hook-associated protein 1 FlgK
MSLFFGINIALKGMMAQQTALSVTSHNIANANTEGYSRQRVSLETSYPVSGIVSEAQLGSGVQVSGIERVRREFFDHQVRKESSSLENQNTVYDTLQLVENVFMEPSETGFNQQLEEFWNAWQELSKNPESSPVRTVVKESAITLVDAFHRMNAQLNEIKNDAKNQIQLIVQEVNGIAKNIAQINKQVASISVTGQSANDLLDKRDLALDKLACLGSITVNQITDANGRPTGAIEVKLDGINDGFNLVDTDGPHSLDTAILDSILLKDGELAGLMQVSSDSEKSNTIQFYTDKLNAIALSIAEIVNDIHKAGIDLDGNSGEDFFVFDGPVGAATIQLNPNIEYNISKIAAASSNDILLTGNGDQARLIAEIRNTFLEFKPDSNQLINSGSGNITIGMFYKNMITELGSAASESARMTENQQVLVNQAITWRESVKSVSEDEEIANMILYQHAFNASAKLISVMDEMLNTIINNMKA